MPTNPVKIARPGNPLSPTGRGIGRDGQPIRRIRIATKLNRTIMKLGQDLNSAWPDHQLLLFQAAATDCTGLTEYVTDIIACHRASIQENFARRFGGRMHTSTYLISGKPDDIERLIEEINLRADDTIEGVLIPDARPYDFKILVQDDIRLLRGIAGIFKSRQINIRDQKVIVCAPPWERIGWPERVGMPGFRSIANIVLRAEVPPGTELLPVIDEIRDLDHDKDWDIRCEPVADV